MLNDLTATMPPRSPSVISIACGVPHCKSLSTITPETLDDWGTCMATGVDKLDPLRGGELLEGLVALCVPPASDRELDTDTSFIICARLFALQVTSRQRPRAGHRHVIHHLRQAVRVTGNESPATASWTPTRPSSSAPGCSRYSLLVTIFDTELMFPGSSYSSAELPCLSEFLERVTPRLAALYDENGDIGNCTSIMFLECVTPRLAALYDENGDIGNCTSIMFLERVTPRSTTRMEI
ncbi:Proteasome activator complex subunit 4 [Operophtera brumata]|uniref:Proteasome activator complex subunit 4 n=1 Tax=Operophtera brumata TaxID=104452 RepID=A0A0L7LBW5_OPEBR|nr:Proteasome activator complex subunit 4 [Operophtera brumata]